MNGRNYKGVIVFLILVCFERNIQGESLQEQDPKKKISLYMAELESSQPKQKGDLYVKLAQAYLMDQNLEQAFFAFLKALDSPSDLISKAKDPLSSQDESLYREALKIYLEHNGPAAPQENGKKILAQYGEISRQHPEYYLLNFIMAAAYANLGQFSPFFETFYSSYKALPDHYLAYKIKAVIHIKIYERTGDLNEKEAQRKAILQNVEKAIKINQEDPGLYKFIMVFASENERQQVVTAALKQLVEGNAFVPRADIAFFVHQASLVHRLDLAQKLVDKARMWYAYSKVVEAAQEYIDKIQGAHE